MSPLLVWLPFSIKMGMESVCINPTAMTFRIHLCGSGTRTELIFLVFLSRLLHVNLPLPCWPRNHLAGFFPPTTHRYAGTHSYLGVFEYKWVCIQKFMENGIKNSLNRKHLKSMYKRISSESSWKIFMIKQTTCGFSIFLLQNKLGS